MSRYDSSDHAVACSEISQKADCDGPTPDADRISADSGEFGLCEIRPDELHAFAGSGPASISSMNASTSKPSATPLAMPSSPSATSRSTMRYSASRCRRPSRQAFEAFSKRPRSLRRRAASFVVPRLTVAVSVRDAGVGESCSLCRHGAEYETLHPIEDAGKAISTEIGASRPRRCDTGGGMRFFVLLDSRHVRETSR